MLIEFLSAFLVGAVIYDVSSHRLPNFFLLLGLVVALVLQGWGTGWEGVVTGGAGFLSGFALLLPFYVLGGMAAGDVKLMGVVGSFLGATGALWAAAFSLIAGSILGVLYLLYKGQIAKLVVRFWAMAALRSYIPAEENDAARHRFPYAIAIASGSLFSLFWAPI